ncbi:MAG: hypothetical protein GXY41_03665 [Phycisphaerae bacterium]|nr:hypothetical protein [Phycisphaerae bacterium]
MGRSRARVECDNLQHLSAKGLAPRVLAYGQNRHWGMQNLSFLVIEEVPDTMTLDTFIAGPLQSLTPRQRRDLLRKLAVFTQTMNAGGYVNSEYHWRNILVQKSEDGVGFQVIDPSGSRLRYKLRYPYFDLATLDVCAPFFFSRTERLRFFKQYQGCSEEKLTSHLKKKVLAILTLRGKIAKKELKRYRKILPNHRL